MPQYQVVFINPEEDGKLSEQQGWKNSKFSGNRNPETEIQVSIPVLYFAEQSESREKAWQIMAEINDFWQIHHLSRYLLEIKKKEFIKHSNLQNIDHENQSNKDDQSPKFWNIVKALFLAQELHMISLLRLANENPIPSYQYATSLTDTDFTKTYAENYGHELDLQMKSLFRVFPYLRDDFVQLLQSPHEWVRDLKPMLGLTSVGSN